MEKCFYYKTKVGDFSIRMANDGRYELWVNDKHIATYESVGEAAEPVAYQTTGHYEWDILQPDIDIDEFDIPTDISAWTWDYFEF